MTVGKMKKTIAVITLLASLCANIFADGKPSWYTEEVQVSEMEIRRKNSEGVYADFIDRTFSACAHVRVTDEIQSLEEARSKAEKAASEKLHTRILEKYIENLNYYENIKISEIRKDKDELKCKVIDKLNEILKGRAIENFLKKNSAELYKSIIEIFSNNLKSKIDEFINSLETNKEVSQFFKSCNALNEEKELKIKGDIDKYIKHLREKEEESGFKAVKIMYGDQFESQGESGNSETIGETGESKEVGDTKINSFSGN